MKKTIFLIFIQVLGAFILMAQGGLIIQNGATLVANGNPSIVVNGGDFNNQGNVVAGNSSLVLSGTGDSHLQTNNATLYQLIIDKPVEAFVILDNSLTISHILDFQSNENYVQLGNQDLQLLPNAAIANADEDNYIITDGDGFLIKENLANFTFPIGADQNTYNPVSITQNGTTDALFVRCLPDVLSMGNTGTPLTSKVVNASWEIGENVNGGSNLQITTQWDGSDETGDFDRDNSGIAHFNNGNWELTSVANAAGSDPFTQSRASITNLGLFMVSSDVPLPLAFLDFKAKKMNAGDALLQWQTSTAKEVASYEIERQKENETSWQTVGTVQAIDAQTIYHYTDKNVLSRHERATICYYRLKIKSVNGASTYSMIKSVKFDVASANPFLLFPNPATDVVYLSLKADTPEMTTQVDLIDAAGKLIWSKKWTLNENEPQIMTLDAVTSGIYWLKFEDDDGISYWEKLVVE